MNALLPKILDRDHYRRIFREDSHWESAVGFIAKKHGLSGVPRRGALGSHIVYRVGNVWIKLMAPLFADDMKYEVSGLRAVEGRLSVETPRIFAEGMLEDWKYILISHVEGEAIRHVWDRLDPLEQQTLASQMAQITKEFGACPADQIIAQRFDWQSFIAQQFNDCETQQKKKLLPEVWQAGVKQFLSQFELSEFQTNAPAFLHADLTFDHFLVRPQRPLKVTGVIDMADCQIGHFEYELVAPCAFIFKGQAALLRTFLIGCGYAPLALNERLSEKLLAWCLLHRYFGLISYFKDEMDACPAADFNALAKKVFPLA